MRLFLLVFLLLSLIPGFIIVQDITQVIKGTIMDNTSRVPLPGVTVVTLDIELTE